MGMFDDLVPAQPVKQDKGVLDWVADTFGPNGNLRGSSIGGVMQGMADPVIGAVQTVANLPGVKNIFGDLVNNTVKQKEAEYQDARASAGRDGLDAARLTGNVASPVNIAVAAKVPMAATTAGRIGQGATLGGVAGVMEPVNETDKFWDEKLKQVGAGAVGGAIATPALGKVGDVLARKSGAGVGNVANNAATDAKVTSAITDAIQETGQSIADIRPQTLLELHNEIKKSLTAGKQLDVAALLRKKDFESLNMEPLLGQITRDPMLWAKEMNLRGVAGVGDPIAARLNGQQMALKDAIGGMANGADESFNAGEKIAASLKNIDEGMRKNVSGLYQAARNDAGKDLDVPLTGLAQDYADVLNRFADKVPSGVRNQFEQLGLMSGNQNKVFTIENADKLLKVINDHVGADKVTNTALGELRNSVKNAVLSADPAGGPFKPAVDAAAQRFRLHEAIPALADAANGNTADDDFIRRFVINGKTNDVQGMGKLLKMIDPDSYAQARAQIGEDLRRAAFGENTAGDKGFAQESFNKRLRQLGTDKLAAFFTPDEIATIKTLGRVGAYIKSEPAGGATNWSNSGAAAFNLMSKVPGAGYLGNLASGAKALTNSIQNSASAKASLSAQVPVSVADLTPQQANILAAIMAGGSFATGGVASDAATKKK